MTYQVNTHAIEPMEILVINLPRHTERLVFQQAQMKKLGLIFQVLPATDAALLSESLVTQLGSQWERPLRKSEISCFLSHKNAWQQVIERGVPTLILEDDAYLADTVPALLQALPQYPSIDMVALETRGRKKVLARHASHEPVAGIKLMELFQDRTGSAGYVLWPSGAEKLLKKAAHGNTAPADAFISSHYDLHTFQVEPSALVQLDMCDHYGICTPVKTESAISNTERPSVDSSTKWVFKQRRIRSQLRMGWRILSSIAKAERRYVKIEPLHFSIVSAEPNKHP